MVTPVSLFSITYVISQGPRCRLEDVVFYVAKEMGDYASTPTISSIFLTPSRSKRASSSSLIFLGIDGPR